MKKYCFSFFVILLITGVFFFGCKNSTASENPDKTVVCFGNSLTAGYGASVPGEDDKTKSYPAFLQEKINIPVINAGVTGDTTEQGLARIRTDVISKNPRIVIIELGANDFFNFILFPPAATKKNLQKIIDKLNPKRTKIYLAKFFTEAVAREIANSYGITNYVTQTWLINQYENIFNELAASNNIVLIEDIWAGVWGIHMSDAVHPDAQGYEIMANNYFNILEPYLLENNLLAE